jgi:hypothetical protein
MIYSNQYLKHLLEQNDIIDIINGIDVENIEDEELRIIARTIAHSCQVFYQKLESVNSKDIQNS